MFSFELLNQRGYMDTLLKQNDELVDDYNSLFDIYTELDKKYARLNTIHQLSIGKLNSDKTKIEHKLVTALKELADLKKQNIKEAKERKRAKDRNKRKDKPVVNTSELTRLRKSMEVHRKVLATAAILVGSYEDSAGTTYDVFDNKTRTIQLGGKDTLVQEIIVINEFGSGRSVYRDTKTKEVLLAKIPSSGRFKMSSGLEKYCNDYFKLYDKEIRETNGTKTVSRITEQNT